MELIELKVEERSERGKSMARIMRGQGRIPAVFYGEGKAARALSLNEHEFELRARKAGTSQLFTLRCAGSDLDGQMALIKDSQIEPLKSRVLHIDFFKVSEGHTLELTVPVEIIGECPSVKAGEAILNQVAYELEIECLPRSIPRSITVDVSNLELGESIHVADLTPGEGITILTEGKRTIVNALLKQEEEEEAPAAAAAVEGAPAEGAPADGADAAGAPAAGGAGDKDKKEKKDKKDK